MSGIRSVPPVFLFVAGCFYVTEQERAARWDLDGDGIERPDDCDDGDPALGELTTWYTDADEDGAGDPLVPVRACAVPEGAVAVAGDCDDTDAASHPLAQEQCDDADNNCDGSVDEGLTMFTWYRDADEDTFGDDDVTERDCARPDGYVALAGDCDDLDPAIHPDAVEECWPDTTPVDEDCDGLFDTDDPTLVLPVWYDDGDADGYGAGAGTATCSPAPGATTQPDDCDDGEPDVHPDADETCNDRDDDCDLETDEDAVDAWLFYEDVDGDGWGNEDVKLLACDATPPNGWTLVPGDCDDADPDVNPTEGCP